MIQTDKVSKNIMPGPALGIAGGFIGLGIGLLAAKAIIDTTQQLATGKKIPKKEKATHYTQRGLNYMLGKKL
jgi:hypothetical protein